MGPKLSIIIPVYNVERYLNDCLDSLRSQIFSDWECFLINDGSSDTSGKLCDNWAARDTRIKAYHKSNGGQSSARNLALSKVTGEYVMFIDSDDTLCNKYLIYNLIQLMNNDISLDFAQFGIKAINESSGKLIFERQQSENIYYTGSDNILKAFESNKISTLVTDKIFRRSSIPDCLHFPEGVYYEDERYLLSLLIKLQKIGICKYGYYRYRLREGSTTNQEFDLRHTLDLFKKDYQGVMITYLIPTVKKLYLTYYKGAIREYLNAQIISDTEELSEFKSGIRNQSPSWMQLYKSRNLFTASDFIYISILKLFGLSVLRDLVRLKNYNHFFKS